MYRYVIRTANGTRTERVLGFRPTVAAFLRNAAEEWNVSEEERDRSAEGGWRLVASWPGDEWLLGYDEGSR